MKKLIRLSWIGLMVLGLVSAVGLGSAMAGNPLNQCKGCHDISPAKRKVMGPPLFGIAGRAPMVTGLPYKTWDEASLMEWLKDPKAVKATTIKVFKVANDEKRAEVVKALLELK